MNDAENIKVLNNHIDKHSDGFQTLVGELDQSVVVLFWCPNNCCSHSPMYFTFTRLPGVHSPSIQQMQQYYETLGYTFKKGIK